MFHDGDHERPPETPPDLVHHNVPKTHPVDTSDAVELPAQRYVMPLHFARRIASTSGQSGSNGCCRGATVCGAACACCERLSVSTSRNMQAATTTAPTTTAPTTTAPIPVLRRSIFASPRWASDRRLPQSCPVCAFPIETHLPRDDYRAPRRIGLRHFAACGATIKTGATAPMGAGVNSLAMRRAERANMTVKTNVRRPATAPRRSRR